MKKNTNMIYIMITALLLHYFLMVPMAFAAASIDQNSESVSREDRIKTKINEIVTDFGYKLFNQLVKSLGVSSPVNKQYADPARLVESGAVKGKTIVVDPGHGGSNPGAVRYDLREADNNLAVGLKVKDLLEKQGAHVIMTRTTDTAVAKQGAALREELQARVDIAHKNNADALISIHTNSNENTAIKGAMTFYYHDASKALAKATQDDMVQATKAIDKGIDFGDFLVLRNSQVPAVLIEMGFISNQEEALKLNQDAYRNRIATGIVNGINRYFENNK